MQRACSQRECLSLYFIDRCLVCGLSVSCNYMQTWLWITEMRTDTSGVSPCAYLVGTVSYVHTCLFSYTAVNSSAWSRLDALKGQKGHIRKWVCKAWLAELDMESGSERGEVGTLLQVFPHTMSLCLSPFPPSFLFCAFVHSCVTLAHAGPQHQRALMRDLWVFDHALPHPLLLAVWVHPVDLVPIAFAFRGETVTWAFGLISEQHWESLRR